jgi:uncharacterized protein YkvS
VKILAAKAKVEIGNRISFQRKEKNIIGIVEIIRDNSVIVGITCETAQNLQYETPKTVVKHINYVVIEDSVTA